MTNQTVAVPGGRLHVLDEGEPTGAPILLLHAGIPRATLVGNSRGGLIAFDTAIEFPDRVRAVVGVGAGLGGFEGDATPDEIGVEAPDRLAALIVAFLGPGRPGT